MTTAGTWVLVVWFFSGPLTDKSGTTAVPVPGFHSQQACEQAIPKVQSLKGLSGFTFEIKAVCLEQ